MSVSNDPPPGAEKSVKVEIIRLANQLKARMGARFLKQETGFLDPEAIAEADKAIEELCETSPETMAQLMADLMTAWEKMRTMKDSPERQEMAQEIFTRAHEIKDIGAMCGYELAAHFAESLRDYIGQTTLNIQAQIIIVQAHLDALQYVLNHNLKDNAGPKAEDLKRMVKIAIDKYG